jgi:hypothetical protein
VPIARYEFKDGTAACILALGAIPEVSDGVCAQHDCPGIDNSARRIGLLKEAPSFIDTSCHHERKRICR